jgi:hypothetical protein
MTPGNERSARQRGSGVDHDKRATSMLPRGGAAGVRQVEGAAQGEARALVVELFQSLIGSHSPRAHQRRVGKLADTADPVLEYLSSDRSVPAPP